MGRGSQSSWRQRRSAPHRWKQRAGHGRRLGQSAASICAGITSETRSIGKQVWPFLLGGEGAGAALLLHGSASDGESLFGLMAPLERTYRVLAPTYPDGVSDITSLWWMDLRPSRRA